MARLKDEWFRFFTGLMGFTGHATPGADFSLLSLPMTSKTCRLLFLMKADGLMSPARLPDQRVQVPEPSDRQAGSLLCVSQFLDSFLLSSLPVRGMEDDAFSHKRAASDTGMAAPGVAPSDEPVRAAFPLWRHRFIVFMCVAKQGQPGGNATAICKKRVVPETH